MSAGGYRPYRYPDEGDRITVALMGQSVLSSEQWEQQESIVLAHVDAILSTGRCHSLLDYGSGLGRLALRYAATFDRVTSYEPDPRRAQDQRDHLAALPEAMRIRVVSDPDNAGIDHDAAICSHVIQHVPTEAAVGIVEDIARRVRRAGHVLVVTTLSPSSASRFVVGRMTDSGRVVEDDVSQETFNATLRSASAGVLPVRFFPYQDLVALLAKHGLDVVFAFGFHGHSGVVGPHTTPTPELFRCRDIAVLVHRR